jgi:hypothetical protein
MKPEYWLVIWLFGVILYGIRLWPFCWASYQIEQCDKIHWNTVLLLVAIGYWGFWAALWPIGMLLDAIRPRSQRS